MVLQMPQMYQFANREMKEESVDRWRWCKTPNFYCRVNGLQDELGFQHFHMPLSELLLDSYALKSL